MRPDIVARYPGAAQDVNARVAGRVETMPRETGMGWALLCRIIVWASRNR